MANSHPHRQPPVDAPGTAVLYIRGFSYTSKEPCSCTRPELLATTSGGSNARLDLSRIPQELQLAGGITPQEFANNSTRLNDKVKKFIPGGSMTLRTVAVPIIVSLAGVVLLSVGLGMCDDPSPKDYWRCCECVENDENCATPTGSRFESRTSTWRATSTSAPAPEPAWVSMWPIISWRSYGSTYSSKSSSYASAPSERALAELALRTSPPASCSISP